MTVTYGDISLTVTLSEPYIHPKDHAPVCNETDLSNGGVGLQGSKRLKQQWTITCLTDDHTEIDNLDTLVGERMTLTIDGTAHATVMITKPFVETEVGVGWWSYTIGFVQEMLSP